MRQQSPFKGMLCFRKKSKRDLGFGSLWHMLGEVMLRHPLFLDWGNVVRDLCPLSHEGATSGSLSAGETHGIAMIGTQLYYLVTA